MGNDKKDVQQRVALYLRVSTDDQVDKYGLDAQRTAIEALIKSKGQFEDGRDKMMLAGKAYEYIDDGISGTTKMDERPEFTRLKEDVLNAPRGQKPFDLIAVYRIDRFARKLKILMDILNFFEEYDIEFLSANESIDTSTPFGRAMLGIMGVIAELELETIKERTQKGREEANLKGVFMGSHPPYGYTKDKEGHLVVLPEETEVVKRIFHLFTVEKITPQIIASTLTQDEILSPDASAVKHGKRKGDIKKTNTPHFWRYERIKDILSDETYTGIRYFNKSKQNKKLPKSEWKLSNYRHEAIVYKYIFQLSQQRLQELSDRKVLTKQKIDNHVYLLSGLLKCVHCRNLVSPIEPKMMSWTGGKDKIKSNPDIYSYNYKCNRKNQAKSSVVCTVVPIPAQDIEDYVVDFVKRLLENPQAVYDYQKQLQSNQLAIKHLEANKKHYEGLLNGLPQKRERLKEQQEINAIDTNELRKKLGQTDVKEKEYKAKIDEIDFNLSNVMLSRGYEASIKLYSEKYSKSFKRIMKDRMQLYNLIHDLVYQIIVYSRPRNEQDIIAGRKKEGQMIPERIDIHLNLPQNLLRQLYTQQFVVKSDEL